MTIQIDQSEAAVLQRAAEASKLSRSQIIKHLLSRFGSEVELIRELRASGMRPVARGRRKQSIFGPNS